jgi:hypothetical protein
MIHDTLAPSLPTAATATPAVTLRTTAPGFPAVAGCEALGPS